MPQGVTSGTKDHSTLKQKLELREMMLHDMRVNQFHRVDKPIVLEAYGGKGDIYRKVYDTFQQGVVIERDPKKCDLLAWQRPTWSVYQGDTPALLTAGLGGHLAVNILDLDPFGQPWDAIRGYFQSMQEGLRPAVDVLYVVVNDGARQYLRRTASAIWKTEWLPDDILERYGNALELNYAEVARELLTRQAAPCGYEMTFWHSYYCGHVLQNTHYLARLETR